MTAAKIFISYSGHDAFEASLLQFAFESLLGPSVVAWTYQRDQGKSEKDIAQSIKARIKESIATLFLVSPSTIDGGAAQWMELAYSDAFDVQTYVLLHHLTYQELKNQTHGVPPLLLSSQCNDAINWKEIVSEVSEKLVAKEKA